MEQSSAGGVEIDSDSLKDCTQTQWQPVKSCVSPEIRTGR